MCDFVALSSGLLTPLIAVIAAYVAYQQWQTNERRLFLDLYDRRLKIYEHVRKLFGVVTRDANVGLDELRQFYSETQEADFLFGPEIRAYIDELFDHGGNLYRWNAEYRDHSMVTPPTYDHKKVVDNKYKELEWFAAQVEFVKPKFNKYLMHQRPSLLSRIAGRKV